MNDNLLMPLDEVVEQCTDKISIQKDFNLPYVGLEHIAQGEPRLIGVSPSNESISINSIFQKDDILFGKLRPNLKKSLQVSFDGYCSTDILVFRAREDILPRFAAHVFRREEVFQEAVKTSEGTKMPRTSWSKLRQFRVFVPPTIQEQRAIAQILDTIDEAIATTTAHIEKLKLAKAGLLHDLLTRGIDENGELRDPIRHPEQFKESELGLIPIAWEIKRTAEIAEMITSGSRGWAQYYSDYGALFIRIGNLTREHLNLRFEDVVYVLPPAGSEGERTGVCEGDVLISITADLGIIGVIPKDLGAAYINQHIALVRFQAGLLNPRWIGLFLAHERGQEQFRRLNDSGAKAGLNLPTVGKIFVALPGQVEQNEIVSFVEEKDIAIALKRERLEKLKLLKKGLMSDLLTGQVRVQVESSEAS